MATTSTIPKLSFEEYLAYDDGTNNRYELVDGELVIMNPPTVRHALIIRLLNNAFESEIGRLNLHWVPLQGIGVRTSIKRSRLPDLCVVAMEQIQEYLDESAVIESPALLAVEIVSPESVTRDYRFKRSEYGAIGIPEYWIVDPAEEKVTVLLLVEGLYEETEYRGAEKIISQTFPELELTVAQVLKV
ncbi:Uma2 family endonuclease [Lyngbya aestuarii]|uniref:Uma2 family endonuclease n=1 Tax=Lyngbya aestuarii TaxID=118322 RepID=UPI00403E1DB3